MTRMRSILTFAAGSAGALGAALLWHQITPAPAGAQSSQSAAVANTFPLNQQEWVVVSDRGDVTVYTRDGFIIRRCVMRAAGPATIDCRNSY